MRYAIKRSSWRTSTGTAGPAGFTLLEVLVALLVLSLGLLGLAALQARTVEFNHSAYLRSQATSLAYAMADRMRANRRAALDGAYDAVDFSDPFPTCGEQSGGSVAARDIASWRSALGCTLPQGHGRVQRSGALVTIGVRWDDGRAEQNPDAEQVNPELFEVTTSL